MGDRVIHLTGTRVARALLGYLLLNPDRHHLRTRLAGIFWPDVPEAQARQRLRSALWKIRTSFSESGIDVLDQHPEWVAVSEGLNIWVDVSAYRELVASLDSTDSAIPEILMAADDLYRGDFLPGHYEDWVFEEQEQLRSSHRGLLRQLMKLRESEGRYEQALLVAHRMLAMHRLDESTYRDIMRLNAILHRPEDANRSYRELKGLMKYELGAEPSAETTQLADDIARQVESSLTARRSSDWSRAPVFVARSLERNHLIDRLESVIGGRGSVVLVEGPPGVGKSSLLEQLSEDAKWRNIEVVWGNYRDRSTEAFEALRGALEASLTPLRVEQLNSVVDDVWIEEAGKIVPSLALSRDSAVRTSLDGEDGQWRMREALVQVVCGLAKVFPTLLILEDVHWADVESLQVLEILATRIESLPMSVCLSYRRDDIVGDEKRWAELSLIDRHSATSRLVLGDLDTESVTALLKAIGGFDADPELMAQRLVQQTSGNPLFVMETLKSLRDNSAGDRIPDELPVADSVGDIVEQRLARLGPESRDVISGAAVFARAISVSELSRLTGARHQDVLRVVTDVVHKQILNDHAEGLLFSHALVRRIAYDRTNPPRLRELHGAAAVLLEEIGAPPAEIAHHYQAAEMWDEAAAWGYESAQAAEQVLALETAKEHYELAALALSRGSENDVLGWSLVLGAEAVANVLGDRGRQELLLDEMESLASSPVREAEFLRRRGRLLANTDRYAEAEAAVRRGISLDTPARPGLEVLLAQIMVWSGNPQSAIDQLTALISGNGDVPSGANRVLGVAYAEVHAYDLAHEQLQHALTKLESTDKAEGRARVLGMIGTVYLSQGEFGQARRTLSEALEIGEAIGFRIAEAECQVNLATVEWMSNKPGAALRSFSQADEAFESLRQQRGSASVRGNMATLLCEVVGDYGRAHDLGTFASGYFGDSGDRYRHLMCELVLARVLAQRDEAAAVLRLGQIADEFASLDEPEGFVEAIEAMVSLHLDQGEDKKARDTFQRIEHLDNPALTSRALEARLLAAESQHERAVNSAKQVLEEMAEDTPGGYRIAYNAFLASASDPDQAQVAIGLAERLLEVVLSDLELDQAALSRAEATHAAIGQAYEDHFPTRITMELPKKNSHAKDLVVVSLTVVHPSDAAIASAVDRRRAQLRRVLEQIDEQGAAASTKHLVRALGASHATIKRDLAHIRS